MKDISSIGTDNMFDERYYFGSITDFRIDDRNNIYVLDGRDFNVKVFGSNASFIKKISLNRGQGPGDYLRPKCISVDRENIYIGDMNNMRISILDLNGNFIKSFHAEIQPAELQASLGKLYVTGYFDYSKERIHVYDVKKGGEIGKFAVATEMTNEVAEFGEKDSICVRDGTVYFSSFFPYDVRTYSKAGKLLKKFSRIEPLFEKKLDRDKVTSAINFVIGTSRVFATSEGYIINLMKSRDLQKNTQSSYLDIFDQQGRWLTTLSATDFGENFLRLADINRHNIFVLDSMTPYPRIKIFSIELTH